MNSMIRFIKIVLVIILLSNFSIYLFANSEEKQLAFTILKTQLIGKQLDRITN